MEALNKIREKMEAMKKELAETGKREMQAAFKQFFEEWPEAEALMWRQYTPYFNDGEPCVFGLHGVYVKLKGNDDGGDHEDGFLESYEFDYEGPEHERMSEVEGLLEACRDVLQATFGDHCNVTIRRGDEAVEVEEYDHD